MVGFHSSPHPRPAVEAVSSPPETFYKNLWWRAVIDSSITAMNYIIVSRNQTARRVIPQTIAAQRLLIRFLACVLQPVQSLDCRL